MQIHELNAYTGTLSDAYAVVDDGADTGKAKVEDITAPLDARIDNIIAGPASSAQEVIDARLGADGVTYASLGDAIRDQFSALNTDVGEWLCTKAWANARYPNVDINVTSGKAYVKIVSPFEAVTEIAGFFINGSNDSWQTQTSLYAKDILREEDKEAIIEFDPTGYTAFKFGVTLTSQWSGVLKVIFHSFDGVSISDRIVEGQSNIISLNSEFDELTVPKDLMSGTNYNKFYLNSDAYNTISSINNASFNVKAYTVTKGSTYYLYGENVALAAALPLAAFGVDQVANNNHYLTKLLDGATTDTNYVLRFTPDSDGYIYVAWITGKNELEVYNTEYVSDAYIKNNPIKNITLQLFGDSITDNQWGDESTWANYITADMPGYNVTVKNEAVGGCGIGHGKSTTTPSHQSEQYNYVYDLVTNGVTLDTSADAIVILVGTNNWASGTALGNMSSSGPDTIYGALKGILEYISQHSSALVFVCTVPQRYNSVDQTRETNAYGEPLNPAGDTLAEFCEPFKVVSAFYGMPCIHLNEALGWNRLNVLNYCGDGLHPNTKGDKKIAQFICSEIKKHI